MWIAVLAVVLALPVMALATWNAVVTADAESDNPPWGLPTGLALIVASGVLVVIAFVRWSRSPVRPRELQVEGRALWALTFAQRRALLHQVLGKVPIVQEDLPGTRITARAQAAQALNLTIAPAMVLNMTALAVIRPSIASVTYAVLTALLAAYCLVVLPGRIAAARRFLREHPAGDRVDRVDRVDRGDGAEPAP